MNGSNWKECIYCDLLERLAPLVSLNGACMLVLLIYFEILCPLSVCLRILGFVQHENMDAHKFPYQWCWLGIGQHLEILCLVLNSSTWILWSSFSTQPHLHFNLLFISNEFSSTHDWSCMKELSIYLAYFIVLVFNTL